MTGWEENVVEEEVNELQALGRQAAGKVAGEAGVKQVEVSVGKDSSDRPVYFFSFLIDQAQVPQRPGLLLIRLIQQLQEDLLARDDHHYPMIEILDEADWARRHVA